MESQHLGVDYSTRKVSVALIDGSGRPLGVRSWSRAGKSAVPLAEAVVELSRNYTSLLSSLAESGDLRPSLLSSAVVEHPIVGGSGNRQTAIGMAMAAGAIITDTSAVLAVTPFLAHVSSWKKEVCGNGSLDKAQVGEWLRDHHPHLYGLTGGDDEVDAVCLALYGMAQ